MFASIEMNRWEVKHSMEAKAGSQTAQVFGRFFGLLWRSGELHSRRDSAWAWYSVPHEQDLSLSCLLQRGRCRRYSLFHRRLPS
jgi:hypothetical protein